MILRHAHPADHLLLLADERELTPQQLARVDDHVAQCDVCRQRRARLQTAVSELQGTDDASPAFTGADMTPLRRRLQNALREQAGETSTFWSQRLGQAMHIYTLPTALAAGVFVAAFLVRTISPAETTRTNDRGGIALPLSSLTPGSVSELTADALCAGERPSRVVSRDLRDQVVSAYGMRHVAPESYELDALVTPELGGTVARANLWPQPYNATWNAHVKDALENLLAGRVCRGETPLPVAQRALADDWIAAYRRYFQTDLPIAEHAASLELDDELIIEGPRPGVRTWPRRQALVLAAESPIRLLTAFTNPSAYPARDATRRDRQM